MGSILNPGNDNSFIRLVKAKDTRVYVDKTDFIEKTNALFNTDGNLIAVTRRFGKTITAHMLSADYSKGYADQKILTIRKFQLRTVSQNIYISMMSFTLI